MSEYDIINLEHEALLLIVTSTFGNGDPPENGQSFADNLYSIKVDISTSSDNVTSNKSKSFIKMNSQTDVAKVNSPTTTSSSNQGLLTDLQYLENLRFAVFALGSTAYPNFCSFGKYVDNLLAELGGEGILQLHTCDELRGQDQEFRAWAKQVFQVSCDVFCVGDDISHDEVAAALQTDSSAGKIRLFESPNSTVDIRADLSKLYNKSIVETHLMYRSFIPLNGKNDQTILLKLHWTSDCPFVPGDHVGICPKNNPDIVDRILSRLKNLPPIDSVVEIQLLVEKQTINGLSKTWTKHDRLPPFTIQTALEYYLDISSPPTPELLELFASFATSEEDLTVLTSLANDSNEYEKWKFRYYPNISEVLEQFPSINIDAVALLNKLPILQPRFYSISSSPMVYRDEIHLTVTLLKYQVSDDPTKLHYGVCSSYLNKLTNNDVMYCFIRNASTFHLPDDLYCPIIMVGPGTGIAPFRGFWQEKLYLAEKLNTEKLWPMTLYFGCRHSGFDLYNTDIKICKNKQVIQNVHIAYSRVEKAPKTYVQHLIIENAKEVYEEIYLNRGHFYVCGDVAMAEDVNRCLISVLSLFGTLSKEEAEAYVLSMRDENRYHEDIFGASFQKPRK